MQEIIEVQILQEVILQCIPHHNDNTMINQPTMTAMSSQLQWQQLQLDSLSHTQLELSTKAMK
jgi:hypothetical protein